MTRNYEQIADLMGESIETLNQLNLFSDTKRDKFNEFHRLNPGVYDLFKRFAFQLINAGCRRLGSKQIIERIRFETAIRTRGDSEFKINNNHTCYYSRLFCKEYPEHIDKFNFKVIE